MTTFKPRDDPVRWPRTSLTAMQQTPRFGRNTTNFARRTTICPHAPQIRGLLRQRFMQSRFASSTRVCCPTTTSSCVNKHRTPVCALSDLSYSVTTAQSDLFEVVHPVLRVESAVMCSNGMLVEVIDDCDIAVGWAAWRVRQVGDQCAADGYIKGQGL